jgi:16S rRNA (cytosine967-C5)-methyltransferase
VSAPRVRAERKEPARERPPPRGAREVALEVLRALDDREAFLQPALEATSARAGLDARDRGLAHELVSGVTRYRTRLDHALVPRLSRGLDATDPALLRVLRLGVYQLFFLTRVPAHAVLHEANEQARQIGQDPAARFVNGVLRAIQREGEQLPTGQSVEALSIRHGHPAWLVERWLEQLGPEETEALLVANNQPAPLTVRLAAPIEAVRAAVEAEGGHLSPTRHVPGAFHLEHPAAFMAPSFAQHLWRVQDDAAQLVALLADPVAGESVWDVCAAPGGKSLHLADLLEGRGRLLSTDTHRGKVERLRETLADVPMAEVRLHDATVTLDETFDRVVLDAPCSGLGTLRRHPEVRWRRDPAAIEALAVLQRKLLEAVAPSVRPGGVLVYSVCTPTREEGPAQVEAFLAAHPDFALERPRSDRVDFAPMTDASGWVQTWPHRHAMDAFFAARLRRRA